ncbi:MAG TPA: hypothetical protein VJ716_04590 [Gaiellaceae bacterium]|nr:hypothetical protein [Gaiellaceae bacterium]
MGEFVTHPITGEQRLRHDGTARLRNESLAWHEVEAQHLAEHPDCERCGRPATEAHVVGGVCAVSPPYDDLELVSTCGDCHDETLCTAPRVTSLDRLLRLE